jgi:hypothetical protein
MEVGLPTEFCYEQVSQKNRNATIFVISRNLSNRKICVADMSHRGNKLEEAPASCCRFIWHHQPPSLTISYHHRAFLTCLLFCLIFA